MKLINDKNINNKTRIKLWILDFGDKRHRRLFLLFICLFCIVITCIFLYDPTKNYYKGLRENEKLATQYQILKEYNQNLSNNIEFIQTEEGIKQTAKQKLNLVQEGENAAYVNGMEYTKTDETPSEFNNKYNSKNIIYPKKWYSGFLDFIFNVSD